MIIRCSEVKKYFPVRRGYLKEKAGELGLPISGYVRYLIIKDVKQAYYPVKKASKKAEKAYYQAKDAERKQSLIQPKNLQSYLRGL